MTNEVVPLLKHTPSAQDPRVLEGITVQREPLIAGLVDAALGADEGLRHRLLIGPRGMGKTHVLTLVASRVAVDPRAGSVLIAWLNEDHWAIRTYDKFLAAILEQVAEGLGDDSLRKLSDSLRTSTGGRHLEGEEALRGALGDRRLVLLAENLDEVFRRIGPEGQSRFRAFVENWRQLLILATAPQLFDGIQKHESPFYGFFAITHLDELSLANATELLRRVAELHEDTELLSFLKTQTAARRLAAVEALAGGHPRIWLLLAGCISVAAIDELVPLFLEALDELTPYYQDRLRELSDQQQELVVLLAEAGGALSNRDLAERSGIGQNQVATMLRQLTERGYVRAARVAEEVATGDQRMSFWELREPLMRLCLDVKAARGRPLKMIVQFLRAWYGPRLLDELVRLPDDAELAASYAGEAFRLLDAGSISTDYLLRGSPEEIIARADRGLTEAPDRTHLRVAKVSGLVMAEQFGEARECIEPLLDPGDPASRLPGVRLLLGVIEDGLGKPDAVDRAIDDLRGWDEAGLEYEQLILLGHACELGRLTEEALEAYAVAIEADPTRVTAYRRRAQILLREKRDEEALDVFDAAVAQLPENASLRDGLGVALRRLGRDEESVAAHRRAVELAPDVPRAHSQYGISLNRAGRPEEAIQELERAVELAPDDGILLNNLGVHLGRLGRHGEALDAFQRATEKEPEDVTALSNMGHALINLERFEEAVAAFRRIVGVAPDDAKALGNLATALNRAGHFEEALPFIRRASEIEPEDGVLQNNLAVAYRRLSRFEEALAPQRRAIELRPENPDMFARLALTLWALDRDQEALEAIVRASELAPDDVRMIRNRGAGLERLGRVEESLDFYIRAIEIEPDAVRYRLDHARALRSLGRYEDSLAVLQAIEVESPDLDESIGDTLRLLGRPDESLVYLDRAADAKAAYAPFHNQRANALRELGRYREAEAAVRQAIEVDGEEPIFRFTLAEVLLDSGDAAAGVDALQDALDAWRAGARIPPGETDVLCQIAWERFDGAARTDVIAKLVQSYEEVDAVDALGSGLVATIPALLDQGVGQPRADAWAADWGAVKTGDLEIPLQMLVAATAWKRDRNRAHLLALPPEQREIVVGMLPRAGDSEDQEAPSAANTLKR